jgi:hypothetical protein
MSKFKLTPDENYVGDMGAMRVAVGVPFVQVLHIGSSEAYRRRQNNLSRRCQTVLQSFLPQAKLF